MKYVYEHKPKLKYPYRFVYLPVLITGYNNFIKQIENQFGKKFIHRFSVNIRFFVAFKSQQDAMLFKLIFADSFENELIRTYSFRFSRMLLLSKKELEENEKMWLQENPHLKSP